MSGRFGLVAVLALLVGASGCTGTLRKVDAPLSANPKAWAEAPAPPQQQVSLPPELAETPVASTSPLGLSKFFPGLRRNSVEGSNIASKNRPSWFTFNRRPKPTQYYMTDARSGWGQGSAPAGAATLPVAIQVPSERASDAAVTPVKAEQVENPSDLAPPAPFVEMDKMANPAPVAPAGPESAPIPPSAVLPEPETGVIVANRMPEVPAVDPRERPRLTTPSPVESQSLESADPRKSDDQARKAIPSVLDPADSAEEPEPTILAAFLHRIGVKSHPAPHVHTSMVLASPQVAPSPQAKPSPQAAPKHVHKARPTPTPTSQIQPSSQTSAHTCVCDNCGAKIGKRPCILKRMRSAIFQGKSGEAK